MKDHNTYKHGVHHRRLPLDESHWSYDNFTDMVNRVEHGLPTSKRALRYSWQPDEKQITLAMNGLNIPRGEAIALLRAAYYTQNK